MKQTKESPGLAGSGPDTAINHFKNQSTGTDPSVNRFVSAAKWWRSLGFTPLPLQPGGKAPNVPNFEQWRETLAARGEQALDDHWAAQPNDQLAVLMEGDYIAFDADSAEALAALQCIETLLDIGPSLYQTTSKGEHHIYRLPAGASEQNWSYSSDKHPEKIDVRAHRNGYVAVWPSTGKTVYWRDEPSAPIVEASQDLIDGVRGHNGQVSQSEERQQRQAREDRWRERSNQAYGETTLAEAREILDHIPPDGDSYDEWIKVGMGIHALTSGSDDGLLLFETWSATGEKYEGHRAIANKWQSFRSGGTTWASVAHIARLYGADLGEISRRHRAASVGFGQPSAGVLPAVGAPLADGGQLALAQAFLSSIGTENVIDDGGAFWLWRDAGVWRRMDERGLKQEVQRYIAHMVSVSRSTVDSVTQLVRNEVYRGDHRFDVGPVESVNCQNGELVLTDSDAWELRPHDRRHYRTTQIPVAYDPLAQAPRFEQFLVEVFQGDDDAADKRAALLEMMGYSLMAHCRHERMTFMVGDGRNGKSVVLAVLEAVLGKTNVAGVKPSQLDNPFQRANLQGKLANVISEIKEGEVIDDASLKSIVSGETTTVERKHKDPFELRPFATCWFGTNHMPSTRDFSQGLFRRSLILTFNNTFEAGAPGTDPKLKEKLATELPGVLRLALEAYARAARGGFTTPADSRRMVEKWRIESDQVAQFVKSDQVVEDGTARVEPQALYNVYRHWADDAGIRNKLGRNKFLERIERLGFQRKASNGRRYVLGLRVVTPGELAFLGGGEQ